MRMVLALVLLAGCGGSKSFEGEKGRPVPVPVPVPVPAPVPDDHALHGGVEIGSDAVRAVYTGRAVAVENIPDLAERVGLPIAGTADVAIDVTIPIVGGEPDYRRATGTIDVRCSKCSLGGEGAKLKPRTSAKRGGAFASDGINFGKIAFDRLEARIELKNERAELVRWVAESPDIALKIAWSAELASTLDQTQVRGCLQFAGKPGFAQREPTTSSLLSLAGGPLGDNGLFHIEVQGTYGSPKLLGRLCGQSATP